MQRLAAYVLVLLLASAPAWAEDEWSQMAPGYSKPMPTPQPVGALDRPTYGPVLLADYPRMLDSTPPLGDIQFFRPPGKLDKASFTRVLIPKFEGQPFLVTLNAVPSYSTFNINYLTNPNAFGNKFKLAAIGKVAPKTLVGVIVSYENEIEQFTGGWRPSSQGGVAGFVSYEVVPRVYLGLEARYWRSYAHLFATRELGHDFFAGGNIGWRFAEDGMITLSYAPRVNKSKGGKSDYERQSRFNADVFDNHPLRFKIEWKF